MVSNSHGLIIKFLAHSSEPQALDYYDGIVDVQSNSASHERITNTRKPHSADHSKTEIAFQPLLWVEKIAFSMFLVHSSLGLSGVQKPLPLLIQY